MRRATLLPVLVLVAVLAVVSTFGTLFPHRLMMGNMGGMMGETTDMGSVVWPTALTASTAAIILAVAYVILLPSIKYGPNEEVKQEGFPFTANPDPMDVVMKVVKPDERAALDVLRNSGGVCLQKDITYRTGLSKLKTHRIVARLAERGIIHVRKAGKTNEISIPDWLKMPESTTKASAPSAS